MAAIRLNRILWLGSALMAAVWLGYFAQVRHWPFRVDGRLELTDVAAFQATGRRVLDGQAALIYDAEAHNALQSRLASQPPRGITYPYPPTSFLFVWPLGLVPYPLAWLAMILCGLAALGAVLRRLVADWPTALGMTFALGGGTYSMMLGQNGMFFAAVIGGGLLLMRRHAFAAGALFSLLSLKPHLGLALGLALVVWREWRVLGWAAGLALVLALTSWALFGTDVWQSWLTGTTRFAQGLAADPNPVVVRMMQSIFAMTLVDLGWNRAWLAHLIGAGLALVVMARVRGDNPRAAAVLAATMIVPPYLFVYDLTAATVAAAFLLRGARGNGERIAIWLVAGIMPVFCFISSAKLACLLAFAVLGMAYWQTIRADREAAGSRPLPA